MVVRWHMNVEMTHELGDCEMTCRLGWDEVIVNLVVRMTHELGWDDTWTGLWDDTYLVIVNLVVRWHMNLVVRWLCEPDVRWHVRCEMTHEHEMLWCISAEPLGPDACSLLRRASSEKWRLYTLRDGLGSLCQVLCQHLMERGVDIQLQTPCTGLYFTEDKVLVSHVTL